MMTATATKLRRADQPLTVATDLTFGTGSGLQLDLDKLVVSRALVQANSGGGKSWLLRALLEQTFGRIQHLVFDPEGEFPTLRERHDYVLAAKRGGDVEASAHTAGLLVRRLMELRASAVFDLYDLSKDERREFVRLALTELMSLPREFWRPVLTVVDEIHEFCPEKGAGEAQSTGAVIDVASRGRKRMFCLVGATQRLGKFHKDAAAELLNKFIGRTSLDVDLKRAGPELGLDSKSWKILRDLQVGDFYAYGPAISNEVRLVRGPEPVTRPPKAGDVTTAPPPARGKVLAVLAQLADLPKEAQERAHTMETLQRRVRELERELKAKPHVEVPVTKVERVEVAALKESELKRLEKIGNDCLLAAAEADSAVKGVAELVRYAMKAAPEISTPTRINPVQPVSARSTLRERLDAPGFTEAVARKRAELDARDHGITGPMQRILDALAWMESIGVGEPEQAAVAFLAGYTIGGGAWNNPRGALKTAGMVRYLPVDRIALTAEGRGAANAPALPLTTEELHRRVLERLPTPERKILSVALQQHPDSVGNDDLASAAGYEPGGGAFNNPRGRLRTLGLIEYPERGLVRARDILFLGGR